MAEENTEHRTQVRWRWLWVGLAIMAVVQASEVLLAGGIDAAISIGDPDFAPADALRDVVLAAGAALAALAFPALHAPRPLTPVARGFAWGGLAFLLLTTLLWLVAGETYVDLGEEDGFIEVSQTLIVVGVAAIAQVVALRLRRAGRRVEFWLAQLAVIGFIGYAGEEISWGQRIFGFESMGAFATANEQGELTLHNFATIPFDTAYYSLSLVLLCVVPLAWHHGGLRELLAGRPRFAPLELFMPDAWVALVVAPAAANIYLFWPVLPVQAMVTMTAVAVWQLWFRRSPTGDRPLVGAILASLVVCTVLQVFLGEFPDSMRNHDEYRETATILAVLAYAVALLRRTEHLQPAE